MAQREGMQQPVVLSLREPSDVIAVIPYLLGYLPRRVLVTLAAVPSPPSGLADPERFGFLASGPLPHPSEASCLSYGLRDLLREAHVRSVVLVSYGDPGPLWTLLLPMLERDGVAVRDALTVEGGRWKSAVCRDPECCPPEGRPVVAPTEPGGPSRVAAECVRAGLAVGPRPRRTGPPRSR